MPRFSVVVPAYNAEETLAETLDAVLTQTFEDWECVVVDDGSSDGTSRIADDFAGRDDRFRVVHQSNTGTSGAYRAGVAAASADLIVVCSADDMLLPVHLERMARLISDNPAYDIYTSRGEWLFCPSGERRTYQSVYEADEPVSFSFDMLTKACFFGVGAAFKKSLYQLTGGHRQDAYLDDYDFWLRALARGARHLYTPEVLSVYRIWENQKSADPVRMAEARIGTFEYLMSGEPLTVQQVEAVRAAIERNRCIIDDHALQAQSQWLAGVMLRLLGPGRSDVAMRWVRRVSGATRPLRARIGRATQRIRRNGRS